MKRILLVDSSCEVQEEVMSALGARFETVCTQTLDEARKCLAHESFDLLILEVSFPEGSGFDLCEEIRGEGCGKSPGDIPVIFLSSSTLVSDKVKAFSSGADDYLVRPFEPLELNARVEARLRKKGDPVAEESSIQKGDLMLSIPFQRALLLEGSRERDLKLTPTEFRLLYFFIKNEGTVLSRSQLLSIIWSDDVHVLTRTIDKHISTLKKKLASRSSYIQSVHSKGYRFGLMSSAMGEHHAAFMVS